MRVRGVLVAVGALLGIAGAARAEVPRLIGPLSGSRVTSQRPAVRWQGGAGRVEWCRDRACTQIVAAVDAPTGQAAPPSPLPAGVVFWRVRAGAAASATWQLWVGRRSAAADGVAGQWNDVDGDGYADAAIGR